MKRLPIENTRRIYMDHTAGKPVDTRVIDAMLSYMISFYGNPSAIHAFGSEARQALEEAREKIAGLINAENKEAIIFTSGATESSNMAIKGVAYRNKDRATHIITSSVEHMSVRNSIKFLTTKEFKTTFLSVDQHGVVNLKNLEEELTKETILVSIMYANGEVGTIQPIKEVSQIVHSKNAYLHVDATAANGQIPIDVQNEGIDLLSMSSNDMYGPKGAAALYIKKGVRIEPLFHGGGQERGIRSGTENIPSIVGFGKAAEIAQKEALTEGERLKKLRDTLIRGL